jgi:hypothetical protein
MDRDKHTVESLRTGAALFFLTTNILILNPQRPNYNQVLQRRPNYKKVPGPGRMKTTLFMAMGMEKPPVGVRRGVADAYNRAETAHKASVESGLVKPL